MKRALLLVSLLCLMLTASYASNIVSATATVGFTYNTAGNTINDNQKADETNGMIAQGLFADGSLFTCTFVGGDCISGATGGFEVLLTPANSVTSSAGWAIYNHQGTAATTADTLVSVTFLGAPGATVFNPCLTNGLPNVSGGGCSGVTAGFGNSASIQSASGGLSIGAAVLYTDVVHLGGTPVPSTTSDTFATIKLTFQSPFLGDNNGGTGNANHNYFGFGGDTDQVTLVPDVSVPEPATLSMVGLALAALGSLKFRRKRA